MFSGGKNIPLHPPSQEILLEFSGEKTLTTEDLNTPPGKILTVNPRFWRGTRKRVCRGNSKDGTHATSDTNEIEETGPRVHCRPT